MMITPGPAATTVVPVRSEAHARPDVLGAGQGIGGGSNRRTCAQPCGAISRPRWPRATDGPQRRRKSAQQRATLRNAAPALTCGFVQIRWWEDWLRPASRLRTPVRFPPLSQESWSRGCRSSRFAPASTSWHIRATWIQDGQPGGMARRHSWGSVRKLNSGGTRLDTASRESSTPAQRRSARRATLGWRECASTSTGARGLILMRPFLRSRQCYSCLSRLSFRVNWCPSTGGADGSSAMKDRGAPGWPRAGRSRDERDSDDERPRSFL